MRAAGENFEDFLYKEWSRSDLVINGLVSEAAFLKMKKRIEEILNSIHDTVLF